MMKLPKAQVDWIFNGETISFRSTLVAIRQLILLSLASGIIYLVNGTRLLKRLWLAVDEVIHHGDVVPAVIIHSRRLVGGYLD